MNGLAKAIEPFTFYTRLHLTELTGLRAATLVELVNLMKGASASCIYHHTHRFLQQHQFLSPEPPNDFAYWVTNILGEDKLGEKLASIDTVQFDSIHGLRTAMVRAIEGYLREYPRAKKKFANPGEEFHFMKSVSFVLPTPYQAHDLKEFAQALKQVTVDSIYFHIFEARLRLEKGVNDFSYWLETSLWNKKLADRINRLDPYTYTMEDLRATILNLINGQLAKMGANDG
jgi:hypothetical protein